MAKASDKFRSSSIGGVATAIRKGSDYDKTAQRMKAGVAGKGLDPKLTSDVVDESVSALAKQKGYKNQYEK